MNQNADYKRMAEFAIPFASAVVKVKKAVDAGGGVELDAREAKAVLDALKMLRTPNDSSGEQP